VVQWPVSLCITTPPVLWGPLAVVFLWWYTNNHITLKIVDFVCGTWRLTGYYRYPNEGRRKAAWDFLHHLSSLFPGLQCIFGDFNDIMDTSEKRGRTLRPNWLINGFRQAILDSGLYVLVEGYPFTCFKSLSTSRVVEERLDRALANNAWFNLFPDVVLENLVGPASDHCPILLNCSPVRRPHQAMRKCRYENAWQLELGFKDFVTHSWQINADWDSSYS